MYERLRKSLLNDMDNLQRENQQLKLENHYLLNKIHKLENELKRKDTLILILNKGE